jgi:hypothetical protein
MPMMHARPGLGSVAEARCDLGSAVFGDRIGSVASRGRAGGLAGMNAQGGGAQKEGGRAAAGSRVAARAGSDILAPKD